MTKKHNYHLPFFMLLFNLFQKLHHSASDQEIELIKSTGLFDHFNENQFERLIHSIQLIKYPQASVIFEEGDLADAIYILVDGSVRVFTYDAERKKIPLARLVKGNYFGEQGILKQGSKTRTASIETIEPITLIKIDIASVLPLWHENLEIKQKLNKIGYQQAIHSLASFSDFYGEIIPFIQKYEKHVIEEFQKGQVIFSLGDKPDKVYFILHGKVDVITKDGNHEHHGILYKGHIFGELGVLENKPRQATLIAKDDVRLLAIDGEIFKEIYQQSPSLKNLLSNIKQIYQLHKSWDGVVEQYIGNSPEIGPTITNLFKMDNGRNLVSVRSLNQPLFTMSDTSITTGTIYKHFKDDKNFTILRVDNHHLVGIESCGDWDSLSIASSIMLNNEVIEDKTLEKFVSTRELSRIAPAVAEELICTCMSVSKNQLMELINKGVRDFDVLSKETGASTVCGSCQYKILELLGDNPWLPANLTRTNQHNSYINSYLIKPKNTQFKKLTPGQYIIIQAKINDKWIERAYTISGKQDGALRITVKKESKGLFTNWLFDESSNLNEVNVSHPQGFFLLNNDSNVPALCFAGGIGITPFIMYMNDLLENKSNKPFHLLYCALTKKDFIFTDEFTQITQVLPSITVTYRGTDEFGLLTENEICDIVKSHQNPDIYICGPEGFVNLITNTLTNINYDKNKIHIEKFVFVGSGN